MVELSQAPILMFQLLYPLLKPSGDHTDLSLLMVDHDIVRLDLRNFAASFEAQGRHDASDPESGCSPGPARLRGLAARQPKTACRTW